MPAAGAGRMNGDEPSLRRPGGIGGITGESVVIAVLRRGGDAATAIGRAGINRLLRNLHLGRDTHERRHTKAHSRATADARRIS